MDPGSMYKNTQHFSTLRIEIYIMEKINLKYKIIQGFSIRLIDVFE